MKTANGATFASPVGIASGLIRDGRGMDNLFSASGVDSSSGLSTFIEIGTCTPEKQGFVKNETHEKLRVDLNKEVVIYQNTRVTPGVSEIVANLLERQQRIIDGKVKGVNKDNLIGINVKAQYDTVLSVPYLTHLDYAR